jgi:hypothetical protein
LPVLLLLFLFYLVFSRRRFPDFTDLYQFPSISASQAVSFSLPIVFPDFQA